MKAVTPVVEVHGMIVNGRYTTYAPLKGIDPAVMDDFDYKIKEGRLLQPGDGFSLVFGGGLWNTILTMKRLAEEANM